MTEGESTTKQNMQNPSCIVNGHTCYTEVKAKNLLLNKKFS